SSLRFVVFSCSFPSADLSSFPTRRSSDLDRQPHGRMIERLDALRRLLISVEPAAPCERFERDAQPAPPGHIRQQSQIRQNRRPRSEEHTSELQSRENLVCRLLLEKKKHTH